MTFISQNEINTIRSHASIVDIISSYIPLTQRGKNYFGVCPFHEDHSPSMSVSSEKQIYKCFSCGATGNVFTFVENYLNVSFAEAVNIVAKTTGISIHLEGISHKESKYKEEYALMDLALKFYQNNLNTHEGEKALQYLKERNINSDAIHDFGIGLSIDQNVLYQLLVNKGYSDKMMADLGLVSLTSSGVYEVFQNRIMFPIHNLDGQVVGFTARCYLTDVTPKYLNSRETYLFKKGHILFNYHRAKDSIRLKKQVIIVEGNMDAIRLYSSGIKNVVALMGTSLTKEQIAALKKLRSKIILMLDNDGAGETATYAIGNQLEENAISFLVVRLSDAKDPDEYIIRYGKEALEENIRNAISFLDFKLNYLKKNRNLNDAADLADYIKVVIEGLKNNPDAILKEVTLQKLSNDYNISYAVLKEQLGQVEEYQNVAVEPKQEKNEPNKNSYDKICEEILFYMMNSVNFIQIYQSKLGIFPTKEHRLIANEILYYYETNKSIQLADFITYAETTPLKDEIMAIVRNGKDSLLTEDGLLELLQILEKKIKEQEIQKLKLALKEEFDINKKMELVEKIREIKKGSVNDESD